MKKIVFACSVILLLLACKEQNPTGNPQVIIETQFGDITLELFVDKAPKTATAFLSYVDSGWYERANFYRVLHNDNQPSNAPKSYLIQGGIWKSNNELAQRVKGIPHESTKQTGLKHDVGIVSMARAEPGTAGTEFFICLDREPGFDYGGENITDKQGFAAFAQVIKGMDIVRKIYEQRERNQYFDPPVMIFSIKRKN